MKISALRLLCLSTLFLAVQLNAQVTSEAIQDVPSDYLVRLESAQRAIESGDLKYSLESLQPYINFLKTKMAKINSPTNRLTVPLSSAAEFFLKRSKNVISSLEKAPYSFTNAIVSAYLSSENLSFRRAIGFFKATQIIYLDAYIGSLQKQGAINESEQRSIRNDISQLYLMPIYFTGSTSNSNFVLFESDLGNKIDTYIYKQKIVNLLVKYSSFLGIGGTPSEVEESFLNEIRFERLDLKKSLNK
jgi:hypothetical protein